MLSQAVHDHYRCPNDFLNFVLTGKLSSKEGYFRFGPHATCYGRSCLPTPESDFEPLASDLAKEVVVSDGSLTLPFDPTEIIDNLRLERYAENTGGVRGILRRMYYLVRPLTTRSLRKRVQQFEARNWRKQVFPQWPVDTTVESLCERLMLLSLRAKGIDRAPFVWFWPDGARGCLTMTHDVETEVGRDLCAELMDLDDAFGIKASFQIIPEKRYSVSPKFLDSIHNWRFEVGVQDLNHDGRLFDSRGGFLRRVQIINRYGREYGARGFRAGVLYRRPEWYDALDLSFDMSVPTRIMTGLWNRNTFLASG